MTTSTPTLTYETGVRSLEAREGSSVAIADTPRGEVLEMRDNEGQLLFQFDPAERNAVLHFPGLQLELRCVDGKVELTSAQDIRIHSQGTVEIAGDRGVRLAGVGSTLDVNPDRVQLTTRRLQARVEETCFEGEDIKARAQSVKVTWGRFQRVAHRVFEHARHVYQRVDSLLHTRAGRVRTEVQESVLIQAGAAQVQAREDVRVQGKSIKLG